MTDDGFEFRLRTARAHSKARDQLRELLRDTSLVQTLAIGVNKAGNWTVLVGGMTPADVPRALFVGLKAQERMEAAEAEQAGAGSPIRLDITAPVEPPGQRTGRRREPQITTGADGNLQAPPGETFMSCAECGASRWYATVRDDGTQGRLACLRCGNEIANVPVYHAAGEA